MNCGIVVCVFPIHAYPINQQLASIRINTHSLKGLQSLPQNSHLSQQRAKCFLVLGLLASLAGGYLRKAKHEDDGRNQSHRKANRSLAHVVLPSESLR
jgi:hypothetical protein